MAILNAIVGGTLDLLLSPFRHLPPLAGLAVVSLATAVAMLLVVKTTSDQAKIAQAKRAMVAALFEMRLFNDDLPALFRAQAEMIRQNGRYLRLSLAPALWMIAPVVLAVAHLEGHYGYAGLTRGQPVLVKATVSSPQYATQAALEAPEQIRVLTPAIWFPSTNEIVWRVTPEAAGEYMLTARIGGRTFTKTLDATDGVARRSPVRTSGGFVNELTYPAERPLPADAGVTSISVRYPSRAVRLLKWELSWITVYAGLSILFAVVLRRPLGVTL